MRPRLRRRVRVIGGRVKVWCLVCFVFTSDGFCSAHHPLNSTGAASAAEQVSMQTNQLWRFMLQMHPACTCQLSLLSSPLLSAHSLTHSHKATHNATHNQPEAAVAVAATTSSTTIIYYIVHLISVCF